MNNEALVLETTERPVIFGLTYLEEEAAEINDVVGCLMPPGDGGYTLTGCDDSDTGGGGGPGTQIP
ncbi:MAG: herpeto-tandem family RiPP [Herpetosiphonaceae bacterium]|nr:herpeto-tandem family RiPP [Herpetosiphonaceae bacterium]